MSGEEENDFDDGAASGPEAADPVLVKAGYSSLREKAKFIGGKVLKYAAIGLIIGAIALPVMGAVLGTSLATTGISATGATAGLGAKLLGGLAMAGPWGLAAASTISAAGAGFAYFSGTAAVTGMAATTAATAAYALGAALTIGAMVGAAFGALGGLVSGFSGASAHDEDTKYEIKNLAAQAALRHEKIAKVKEFERLQATAAEKLKREYGIDSDVNRNLPMAERFDGGRAMS